MKKITLFLVFAFGPALLAFAGEPAAPGGHPDSSRWEDLFAADLSNTTCPQGAWAWKDGELSATKDVCLLSNREYENFVIDFEFKLSPGGNSGLIVYATDVENWIPHSLEIQIADTFGQEASQGTCASIYGHVAPAKQLVKPAGQWNRMTVTCRGSLVSVQCNGQPACQADLKLFTSAKTNPDGTPIPGHLSTPLAQLATKGRVGLQGQHGKEPTFFRNLKIKPLD